MQMERLSWLIQQHLANAATLHEKQELVELVHTGNEQELFTTTLAAMMQQQPAIMPGQAERWQRMVQDIMAIDKPVRKPVFTMARWVAAAAVIVLISIAMFFMLQQERPAQMVQVNKNVLTLADGSKIFPDELQNGVIAKQQNATITKLNDQIVYTTTASDSDIYYNVLSTAKGSLYQLVLPDGSHVWLNNASSIRFPTSFSEKDRIVALSGEAWFDVQHAETIPFLIHTGNITTAVKGTAFNIKAYPQQNSMTVSVQRGIVQIQSGDKTITTLQKGQQARVADQQLVQQQAIDTTMVAGWRQGNLVYKDETVEDILADLQRVYQDTMALQRPALAKEKITISFHKTAGARKALEIVCRITDARLLQKNGVYIIE
jgi:preprotein translocase subunit YajC